MAVLQFDASTVEPSDFEVIPPGQYVAAITASEIKPTKSGSGQYLQLSWTILEGEYARRVVIDRLNIINSNPKAVEIGRRQLSLLCRAVGVMQVVDSIQLHNRPCQIKVAVRPASDQYNPSNEVKSYRPIQGNVAPPRVAVSPAPSPSPTPTPAPASASATKEPSWKGRITQAPAPAITPAPAIAADEPF